MTGSLALADLHRRLDAMGRVETDPFAAAAGAFPTSGHKVIAVDDDPTGTQTVAGMDLITSWSDEDVDWLLARPGRIGFVLTNSRAATRAEAVAVNLEVGQQLRAGASRAGIELTVVSRSDSTLRGHYPAEFDALSQGLGRPAAEAAGGIEGEEDGRGGGVGEDRPGTIIAPFFAEGGRLTIDGVHYVRQGDELVPAADTSFARDETFGYRSSDLRNWVEEKTGGAVPADTVGLVSIETIRTGGVPGVAAELQAVPPGGVCVVDSVDYDDLATVVAAIRLTERGGRRWSYRSAASLVPTLVGLRPALPAAPPFLPSAWGGLVVAGSHVPLSSRQLQVLLDRPDVQPLEVSAPALAATDRGVARAEVGRVIAELNDRLADGRIVVVFTSRDLVVGVDGDESLKLSERVAAGICDVIRGLQEAPAYLVAKGGITSHTIAVDGLGARRARVIGPVIPGVPMWEMDASTRFPGLPYVVFPGNVGDDGSLADVVDRMESGRR